MSCCSSCEVQAALRIGYVRLIKSCSKPGKSPPASSMLCSVVVNLAYLSVQRFNAFYLGFPVWSNNFSALQIMHLGGLKVK